MRTTEIRNMIQKAVSDEERTGQLANALSQLARQGGVNADKQEIESAVSFVREYIEHVPQYLEQGTVVAMQLGLDAEMRQVSRDLENYWFEANDIIPDHLGLMGLMDDAYATLVLLQSLSDYCQAAFGRPLLQQNYTQPNQGMRRLIGEPAASMLEQHVGIILGNAMMQRMMGQLVNHGFPGFGASPDPIWGNASVEEIANVRLGALGIF
jgi:hypothetical protein